jgi:hypothetical protein
MTVKLPALPANTKTRAQTMTEFALALPIFLMLILGVFEMGRLLFVYSAVFTASREAARYGSATGIGPNGVEYFRDCAGMRAAARRIGSLAGLQDGQITITYDKIDGVSHPFSCSGASLSPTDGSAIRIGDRVIVQIYQSYSPIFAFLNLPPFPVGSNSRRTIVRDLQMPGSGMLMPTPLPTLQETANLTATYYFGSTATYEVYQTQTAYFWSTATQYAVQTATANYWATATEAGNQTATAYMATQTALASITPDIPLTQTALVQTVSALQTLTAGAITATANAGQTATAQSAAATQMYQQTVEAWHLTQTAQAYVPPCPQYVSVGYSGDKMTLTYSYSQQNATERDITLTGLYVTFSGGGQKLEEATLNSVKIFDSDINSSPATIPSSGKNWITGASRLISYSPSNPTLVIKFRNSITSTTFSDYLIRMSFDHDCSPIEGRGAQ